MTNVRRLVAASRADVPLPESGWTIRVVRANTYQFLKLNGPPLGSMLQSFGAAAIRIGHGESLSDEEALALNQDTPTYADVSVKLLELCVKAIRVTPEEWTEERGRRIAEDPATAQPEDPPWERLRLMADDIPETELPEDAIRVDDFVRSLSPEDLGELNHVLWDLNGLGKGVAKLLEPFRTEPGTPPVPDGPGVRSETEPAPPGKPV